MQVQKYDLQVDGHDICQQDLKLPGDRFALALLALGTVLPAAAQNYPTRPVRLVSPFPPGCSVDVVGRMVAAKLSENLGQQVIVDNRSDASGIIGTEVALNSPPDRYTLLINTIPFVSNQFMMARSPYDPVRDFACISHVASSPSFVTVHPSLPVKTIKELIALAKARPDQLNYSAAGVGTNPHIAGELFNLLAEVILGALRWAVMLGVGSLLVIVFGYVVLGRLPVLLSLPELAFAAVAFGALAFLNTWDLPIYLFLLLTVLAWQARSDSGGETLRALLATAVTVGVAALLLYLPWFLSFRSQLGGILPNLAYPTRLSQFGVMFATSLLPLVVWLLGGVRPAWRREDTRTFLLLGLGWPLALFAASWILS